ncbi:MAG: VWA domain-containing protein [Terracidiphilus sp.]
MSAGARAFAATVLCFSALTLCAQLPAGSSSFPLSQAGPGQDRLGQEVPGQQPPLLQVHVREVLIPVVIRDADGHEVGDLKQEDFKVFDQGKQRKITGFSLQQSPASETATNAAGEAAPSASPAAASAPGSAQPPAAAPRTITFLFDDRHLGPADLEQVKLAGLKMLDAQLPVTDRGLVLSFLGVNSGLTHNHAVLQAAVMKLKAREAFQPGKQQCPDIDYYAADQILNKHNSDEFDIAKEKAGACSHITNADMVRQLVETSARESLEFGEQDACETLAYVLGVVRTVAKFPGQRTLILISPGFLSSSEDALTLQSQILDMAAELHVTVSALDARGLFSALPSVSQNGPHSMKADMTGQPMETHLESMRENEDVMAALADGTGGTFFHNNNDLEGGLQALAAGPKYLYVLNVSLQDVKPNGAYHGLKVEVDRPGVKVQTRRGYFAPFPPRNK